MSENNYKEAQKHFRRAAFWRMISGIALGKAGKAMGSDILQHAGNAKKTYGYSEYEKYKSKK